MISKRNSEASQQPNSAMLEKKKAKIKDIDADQDGMDDVVKKKQV